MDIKKLFVVGAGIMGAGVGQLCAQKGYEVTVVDISEEIVEKAKGKVRAGLSRRVEKGKITQDEMESVLSRMNWSTDLDLAKECDLVVEAASENLGVKKEVFKKLDSICLPETILATNTTALSVSEIASATSRPDKVIGMHFFNPAVIMKLVEIIRGEETSDETIATAKSLQKVWARFRLPLLRKLRPA